MTAVFIRKIVDLTKATEYCSRCFTLCAPTGNLDIDPLCTGCKFDLKARDAILPIPTPHDLAFLLQEPADSMMTGQYDDYNYYSDLA